MIPNHRALVRTVVAEAYLAGLEAARRAAEPNGNSHQIALKRIPYGEIARFLADDDAVRGTVQGILEAMQSEKQQAEPTVTRLPVAGSQMAPMCDAIERMLSVMRRNGMETMLGTVDGYRISVTPENRTPPHE